MQGPATGSTVSETNCWRDQRCTDVFPTAPYRAGNRMKQSALFVCIPPGKKCAASLLAAPGNTWLQQHLWAARISILPQVTHFCPHCTYLQRQTPILSATLLLFPCVCIQVQKVEVASVLPSVFCAFDPFSAFVPVPSVAFPYPSSKGVMSTQH